MKKIIIFASLMLFIPIASVSAHVKWFVDSATIIADEHGHTPFYYLTSKEVLIWAFISIGVVVLFSLLDRIIQAPKHLFEFAQRNEASIVRIAQAVLGLFLVSVTFLWKIILIPEIPIHSTVTIALAVIQVTTGLMFIANILPRVASVLLLGLYLSMAFFAGATPLAENVILLSLAVFFFIKHSPIGSKAASYNTYSVEIVRIGVGISLIVLAFTEKLMYPELGLAFLSVHHWNFMQLLGLSWYSDKLFVLSTGFAEMIFGILFIFGYITRITTILIAGFFATSVITMLVQFKAWEVEDLVVYSAAIILLFFGAGVTRFFHTLPENHYLRRKNIRTIFKKR